MPVPTCRMARVAYCAVLLGLGALCACQPALGPPPSTFVLPMDRSKADQAVSGLLTTLVPALVAEGVLQPPYPLMGDIASVPDPENPNGSLLSCDEAADPTEGRMPCISLNTKGDFIRLQAVTWQTEAAFMYRFYFAPEDSSSVDMTRDFVALDVFLGHEPSSIADVDAAIQKAARQVGADPFEPTSAN